MLPETERAKSKRRRIEFWIKRRGDRRHPGRKRGGGRIFKDEVVGRVGRRNLAVVPRSRRRRRLGQLPQVLRDIPYKSWR